MASAAPSENVDRELSCSICLDTFDCPSTLSCGHSFCLQCLEDAWKETDSYCCPQCRKTFPRRLQLTRNETITNLIKQLLQTMAAVVFCDHCPEGKTPAVKTCFKCEMSFCTEHLVPHLERVKLKDHVLVSPDVNPEERKCKRHKEELNFYSKQDLSLVCRDCAIAGDHMGHKLITLEDEHRTQKNGVGEEMRAVEEKRKKVEASVGRMEATRKVVQDSMAQTKARISGEFIRMRATLDEDERAALDRVDVKGRELLSQIEENIAHFEREISELQAAATRLHALQEERDSLAFLQVHLKETNRRDAQKGTPPPSPKEEDIASITNLLAFMYTQDLKDTAPPDERPPARPVSSTKDAGPAPTPLPPPAGQSSRRPRSAAGDGPALRTRSKSPPSENVDRELSCSICLDTFDCPSTLSCGHSFCLQCLKDAWKETDSYCCPQCQQLRVIKTMAAVVFCDHCPEGKTPAVKTCLKCEMSFCKEHLVPHLERVKLKDHVLVSPDVNPEERKCKRHKEELKFFCKQDLSLVCRDCTIEGHHTGHKFITLEDEHQTRKSGVGEETRAVEEKRKKAEASLGRMEATRKDVQDSMAQTKARISGEFTHMRATLDEDERAALNHVDMKGRELLSQIEENIAHYEREISDLQAAATRLHALQEERDLLTFLQIHLMETTRRDAQKGSPPSSPSEEDIASISALQGAVVNLLAFMYGRSPTLDPNSAHNNLQISSDLRTVMLTAVFQGRPDHPHRFDDYTQALCSESFSSGQHYWEVDVGSAAGDWDVGVAYRTIAREGHGDECSLGQNDSSWVLCKINNSCYVWHSGVETSVPVRDPPRRVGCHLNWEAGLLSFYCADSMELLHSIHHSFSQPLYPGLYVYGDDGDSVKILDLSRAS
ncbi:E3 ubiquitin-protein ligase TRIM7-like [Lampetra planeri]